MGVVDSWLGMSLATAAVVIGWVMGALCCLEGIFLLLLLKDTEEFADKLVAQSEPNRDLVVYNLKMFLYAVLSVYLMFDVLDLVASVLLILGAQMNYRYMLVPWLLSNAIAIVIKLLSSCCACFVWTFTPNRRGTRVVVCLVHLPLTDSITNSSTMIVDSWFGMSLPAASTFIGWAMLIWGCIELIIAISLIKDTNRFAEESVDPSEPNRSIVVHKRKIIIYIALCVSITLIIFDVTACVLLIKGASDMDSKLMLVPWLLSTSISIVIELTLIVYTCVYLVHIPECNILVVSIFLFLITGLRIWMWLVVYSLFVDIDNKGKA